MPTLNFAREIPVRHTVDVLVAGGGPAGCAAALAARRAGRSVFLAEAHTCLGGLGTAGLVPAFMQFTDGENFLAGGIGREIYGRLHDAGGTGPGSRTSIRAEVLKRLYETLMEEADVPFAYMTALVGVETDGPQITAAVCAAKSGLYAVRAKMFVDCTGDGDLAALAGAPFEKGDEQGRMMPGTLAQIWADVDWDAMRAGGLGQGNKRLEEAFADGVFTVRDRHLPGMWRVGERLGGGNVGHTFGVDGTDERSITQAICRARKTHLEYERYYKEYLKGFENMELVATGSLLGIRETRRVIGDYVLGLDDFKARATFDDEIGRYSYPVDIHASTPDADDFDAFEKDFRSLRYGTGESYGIPYRILTPKGIGNLFVAGRCVSSDRAIQGSIRVMPGCYITGQAAGLAAALAVEKDTDTRGVPIPELQSRLKSLGAYLPNTP